MVFYLLSPWGAHGAVRPSRLPFDPEQDVPRNVEYYLARTSDGSTLSGVVHSWVLARLDRARSWDRLRVSLESDVGDIQDGTTREGIHLGAIAGTVDIVQRAHMGLVCATTVCGSTRVCPRSWSASNGAAQPRSPHPSRGEARGSSADHVSREGGSDPCGVPERGRGGAPGHHDGMADRPGGLLIERRGRGFAVGAGGCLRRMPGLQTLLTYQRGWLRCDLMAGVVLHDVITRLRRPILGVAPRAPRGRPRVPRTHR